MLGILGSGKWTPKKLGGSLILWLATDRSLITTSIAGYAGAGTVTQTGTTVTGASSSFLA